MAMQAKSPSIAPILAVTILTSICVTSTGAALASELSASMAFQPTGTGENRPQHGALPSADTVAEARWARLNEDYVLGESGQIVPEHQAPELIGVPAAAADGPETNDNHFDSGIQFGTPECGPSPATPAEITRLVVEAAERHNVDVGFAVAVVTAESRLDRLRNSPKGARGPMQLMPATAKRFGVTDICDPEENIDGGVRYLRELTDEFRNPLLVAAAYNAGEMRVREHGGIPPFKETLGYVAEVLNIEMGIEGSGSTRGESPDAADEHQRSSTATGVITSRERRQWVGGVMHF
ncbi:lytic transglycosylase domain-containing protein [Allomesorhizobium camelthorni]|uniref:lytic transglycosylase domain-containing protein n=1 Tax=Allomesorhizobium camelthorni TaxID=475069 RepID=UPI001FE9F33A|nr:lytic transglycosylase domain-containing protein [Mesorhizobium camelthorni]